MSLIPHQSFLKFARKILSSLFSKEAKTPLAFFLRSMYATVALVALGVLWLQPKDRPILFIGAGIILFLLAMIVAVIAWSRPRNLVYGETGYCAARNRPAISPARVSRSKGRSAA